VPCRIELESQSTVSSHPVSGANANFSRSPFASLAKLSTYNSFLQQSSTAASAGSDNFWDRLRSSASLTPSHPMGRDDDPKIIALPVRIGMIGRFMATLVSLGHNHIVHFDSSLHTTLKTYLNSPASSHHSKNQMILAFSVVRTWMAAGSHA